MIASQFHELFRGLERRHGQYRLFGPAVPGQKHKGQASTVAEPVTDELWELHLAGQQGLGVVPITDDATCLWGAIDVDIKEYPGFTTEEAEKRITESELPLVVCRSKSGGGHLYLFLTEPAQAALVRRRLHEWAHVLQYPGVEIFPKQDALASDSDTGSWINMPYFDAENTARYAIFRGARLSAEAFIEYATARRISPEKLESITQEEPEHLKGAPPCLQFLASHPERISGNRNNFLFSVAVYLKKRYPDEDQDALFKRILDMNKRILGRDALPIKELRGTINKSFMKKDYFYKCSDQPLVNVCDKTRCRDCEFGIGGTQELGVEITDLEAFGTEPTIYHMTVNGRRIRLEGSEYLMDQRRFALKCLDRLRFMPAQLKAAPWRELVNGLMQTVVEVETPEDTSPDALMWYYVNVFCTGHNVARQEAALVDGGAYGDDVNVYFTMPDLLHFLETMRFPRAMQQGNMVANFLLAKGASVDERVVSGKRLTVWAIPRNLLNQATERRDVRIEGKPEF